MLVAFLSFLKFLSTDLDGRVDDLEANDQSSELTEQMENLETDVAG